MLPFYCTTAEATVRFGGVDEYEYVAVELPKGAKGHRADDAVSEALNRVAAHGYRLAGVLPAGQFGGGMAIMERRRHG